MAELESSLISERVKAGMKAAQARGERIGRPATAARLGRQIEELAETTDLSMRKIQETLQEKVSRADNPYQSPYERPRGYSSLHRG